MTTYVLEAKENYDSSTAAALDAGTLPKGSAQYTQTQTLCSCGFDPVGRTIVYGFGDNPNGTTLVTNSTGFHLYSGTTSINAGATYDESAKRNFNVVTKEIDTGAVTFFTAYDASSTVPNGVDGSDGTWRRFIESTASVDQNPHIVDVQTGNLWCHFIFSGCSVECLRLQDSYAKTLSPFTAGAIFIWGLSDDWAFITTGDTPNFLLNLVPRLRTADEITADHLLSYAQFDTGEPFDTVSVTWSVCVGGNQHLYAMFLDTSPSWNFKLLEFTPPSAFVYPTPPVDGGWADVTPWGSTDGPNAHAAAWSGANGDWSVHKLMWLHATNRLVVLTCYAPQSKGTPSTDPLDYHLSCGYFTPSGATWAFTGDFVTGYMTSAWAMTSDPSAAAYAIRLQSRDTSDFTGIRFSDQYRDYNGHAISDLVPGDDDSKRLFYFEVNPVSGGVVDTTTQKGVFAIYQFDTAGVAAPSLVAFYPTQGWTDAYPAYSTDVGGDVVQLTLYPDSVVASGEPQFKDDFIWDSANNAIWASGAYFTFYDFDSAFTGRTAYANSSAPWMRLSFTTPPPPPTFANGYVRSYVGKPQLSVVVASVTPPATAPVNTVAPSINQAQVGSVSTCTPGTWTGTGPITFTYQWKVDGAPVDGATTAAYTPVSGDDGKSLECDVTAHNTAGDALAPSNSLTVTSGSFIDIPDHAALMAMLDAGPGVSGGKSYRLAANDFGELTIHGYDFSSSPIVIAGQATAGQTTAAWADFVNSSGMTWETVTFNGSNPSVGAGASIAIHDSVASTLVFDSVITDSGAAQGAQSGGGWYLNNLANCSIVINGRATAGQYDVQGRNYAVSLTNCDSAGSISIADLTIDNNGTDGIIGGAVANLTVDGCLLSNFYWEPGAHPDAIQFFAVPPGSTGTPTQNLVVKNCGIDQGAFGMGMQGIFLEDVVNVTLQDNWIYEGNFADAISMARGGTALFDNNFVQGFPSANFQPAIISRGGTTNNTVTNNTATDIAQLDTPNPGYSASGNTIIANAVSYGDYTELDAWLASHPTARRRA